MRTRRDAMQILVAVPLLSVTTSAVAQESKPLFYDALGYLAEPRNVEGIYRRLFFYLSLLARARPGNLADARKTYELLGQTITRTEGKFDRQTAEKIVPDIAKQYDRSRPDLFEFLKNVGIDPGSPAGQLVEQGIASMMLFYAAANNVTDILKMKWCFFPFCFENPG